MGSYLGIIVEQSLRDPRAMAAFDIVATWVGKTWVLRLVAIPEDQLDAKIATLQANMVTDDEWYAHFFLRDQLVAVFREAIFRVTTDPKTWGPAVQYGLDRGIPAEQLDFKPRTREEAGAFFGVALPPTGSPLNL